MGTPKFVGIDFGTSNSAVAFCSSNGAPELIHYADATDASRAQVMRSVLYFEPGGVVHSGTEAIDRYLENESEGRLVQSIKSYLASATFHSTSIHGRRWSLPSLVGRFIRALREGADHDLGRRAVVGRPVRYWGAESERDDERAIERMTEAMALAGFDDVSFVPEPVAAASSYAARVNGKQRAVIADFGGGTSDFSVLEIIPKQPVRVLANAGIGIGGDSFDARVLDKSVASHLGKGTTYRDAFGAETPVPAWLFQRLRRWHQLSFLKAPKTMALIERIENGSSDLAAIERLRVVIEDDLGLALHRAVEGLKVALSADRDGTFSFQAPGAGLEHDVERTTFEGWIQSELAKTQATLDLALERADLEAESIDCVFATGGSSLVPAVRAMLHRTLPRAELASGEELTSVASGLARVARERGLASHC